MGELIRASNKCVQKVLNPVKIENSNMTLYFVTIVISETIFGVVTFIFSSEWTKFRVIISAG